MIGAASSPRNASSFLVDVVDHINTQSKIDQLAPAIYAGGPGKWGAIRKLYALVGDDYQDRYPIDWLLVFTPIEYAIWCESHRIQAFLLPQYPVGKCFVDFALPKKRLAIECDGKAFHSNLHQRRRDMQRDDYMRGKLITTLRFSGARIRKDSFACAWEALEEVTSGREKRGNDGLVSFADALGGALGGMRPSPLIWSDRK